MRNDKAQVSTVIAHILKYFVTHSYKMVLFAFVVIISSSICTVMAPFIFSAAIDSISSDTTIQNMLPAFTLYAFVVGVSLALSQMIKYLAAIMAENLSLISSTNFFERLLKKDISFFAEHNAAEIQSAQSQGTEAINTIIQLGLMYIVPTIVQLALTLFILGSKLNLAVSSIVLAYGCIYILLIYLSNNWARPHLINATTAIQQNAKFVGNIIPSLETLRFFGSANWIGQRFNKTANEIYENWRAFCVKRMCYCILYGIAIGLQFLITYIILLPQYKSGTLSIGDIVLFNMLLLQLNLPFEMVGLSIDNFVRAFAKLAPFSKIWSASEQTEASNSLSFEPEYGRLQFNRVSYKYDNGRGIDSLSFVAERGKITFLVGPTGSGKSTVLKLALQSISPQSGLIVIDGQNLDTISRQNWYSKVGVVPQEVMLLNENLAINIVLGRDYDEQRLYSAARRSSIYDRIMEMPEGFNTVIGERGLKLSGGERQRIAIARALYSNPDFLFLDEASSALDDKTEKKIMQEIRKLAHEVTVVAITHQKSIVTSRDQIVILHESKADGSVAYVERPQ